MFLEKIKPLEDLQQVSRVREALSDSRRDAGLTDLLNGISKQREELWFCGRNEWNRATAGWAGNAAQVRSNSSLSRCFRKWGVCTQKCVFGVRLWASHHQWDVENASLYSHVLPAIFIKHMLVIWKMKRGKKDTNATSRCSCQIHQPRKQTCCPGSASFSDRASGKPNHG